MSARSQIELFIQNRQSHQIIDDLVRDQMAQKATTINNRGISAQLTFLAQHGITEDEVLRRLRGG